MARPVRIEFAGAIYHVSSRMIGSWRDRRESLFVDNRGYQEAERRRGTDADQPKLGLPR